MPKEFNDKKHRDKILDRIQKLLNVADGTQYEEEAKTALRMAQSYMKQYGLSRSDVEIAKDLEGEIVHEILDEHACRKNPEKWEALLCMAVGVVFDCQAIRTHSWKGSKMSYVGFKRDVEFAKVVFNALYVSCRSAAVKSYPRGAGKIRLSFMYGAAETVYYRAYVEKETAKEESTGKYGLVVAGKENQIQKWTDENMNLSKSRSARTISLDPEAYEAGSKYGEGLDLMNREKVDSEILRIGTSRR